METTVTTISGEILPLPALPDEQQLSKMMKGHRNRRGHPTPPIDPLALVEVTETGEVKRVRKNGRPTRFQNALRKISPDLIYDLAKLYYRTPDIDTLVLITGHKKEFLTTMMQTAIWQEKLLVVRKELDRAEEAKTTAIMQDALEVMHTSLKEGDDVLDSKTGKVIKMKVRGHVAATIAKTAADLRKDARNENKNNVSTNDTMHHLSALADKFANLVKRPGDSAKVIDSEEQ